MRWYIRSEVWCRTTRCLATESRVVAGVAGCWQDIVDTKLKVGESLKDSAEFILPDSFHER